MLMPRFSVRWLLLLTAVCAGLSLIIAAPVNGRPWAIGVAYGLGALALTFVIHGLNFLISLVVSSGSVNTPAPQRLNTTSPDPPPDAV